MASENIQTVSAYDLPLVCPGSWVFLWNTSSWVALSWGISAQPEFLHHPKRIGPETRAWKRQGFNSKDDRWKERCGCGSSIKWEGWEPLKDRTERQVLRADHHGIITSYQRELRFLFFSLVRAGATHPGLTFDVLFLLSLHGCFLTSCCVIPSWPPFLIVMKGVQSIPSTSGMAKLPLKVWTQNLCGSLCPSLAWCQGLFFWGVPEVWGVQTENSHVGLGMDF